MEQQKEIEEMKTTKQPSQLVNNILFCYEGETHTGNDITSYNTKKITVITRKPTLTDQRAQVGK